MGKQITVDFYQVEVTDQQLSFENIIKQVNELPQDETRNLEDRSDLPIRLQELHSGKTFIEGDMIRIRMDEIPIKVSLTGDMELFDLKDDEGVGEESAFLYHPALRIIAIQRNKYGVSASKLAWYFKAKSKLNGNIDLHPVIRSDVLQRLARMSVIRKMNVRIAGIENASIFQGQGLGIDAMLDLAQQFQSPNLSLELSMGKRKGTLNIENVIAAVKNIFRLSHQYDKEIKQLEISGQEPEGGFAEPLNILKAKIVAKVAVESNDDRRLLYATRRHALLEAWNLRKVELERMFRK
ncbi:MAG: hypothetical protein A4E66_00817 [Syntrophus sp. PtaB.Bin001]|nr:MAG: hypothetical protein A4E66_00817 [Syntrophus sp. PtaB.Bin001]